MLFQIPVRLGSFFLTCFRAFESGTFIYISSAERSVPRRFYSVVMHSNHSKQSRFTAELLVWQKVYIHAFLLSVVMFYLWLVKYSFYRKLVEMNNRQRAQEENVSSVKPAVEQLGLT